MAGFYRDFLGGPVFKIPHGAGHGQKKKESEYIGLNMYVMYGKFTEEYIKKDILIHLTDEILGV